jgi:membrane-associated phospholipid phosphatase
MITLWWKISVHPAIAAGPPPRCYWSSARRWLAAWPLVAVIAWSRIQLGDHMPAQVLAGVALGIVVTATILPLLR